MQIAREPVTSENQPYRSLQPKRPTNANVGSKTVAMENQRPATDLPCRYSSQKKGISKQKIIAKNAAAVKPQLIGEISTYIMC